MNIRITEKSATTFDLFITNNKKIYTHSGVCHMGISDHSLIYGVTKFVLPKGKQRLYPLIRLTTLGILLKKLQLNGLEPHAVQWFKSYLANRFQSIYVNKTLSDYLPISCGVPQGSFLRPLLFLNDLQECELSSFALMYADDTSLTLSAYDPTKTRMRFKSG